MKKQIKKTYWLIDLIARNIAKSFIRLYQYTFSPDKSLFFSYWLKWSVCKHDPHCSQYWYECFDRYNFFTATYRTMDRISRCTPWIMKSYDPVKYRVVFASWSPIWVSFLETLVKDPRYDVVGVLTMPDMASWRWLKIQENIISETALNLWVTNIQKPKSLRLDSKKYFDDAIEVYDWFKNIDIDILYVVAYWNIIPQHILDIPKIAPINIHGSLLPYYRWSSPLQTVFLDWLKETWITLMKMEAGLDSWPIIDKQIFKLSFVDTVFDLIQKVKKHTPIWSLNSIDSYVHWELIEEEQNISLVTYCSKIQKEDWLIVNDFLWKIDTLENIYRKYKAYILWPKIYFYLSIKNWISKKVIIDELILNEELFLKYKNQWLFIDSNYSLNPAIVLLKVKPEWWKTITWMDFMRWYMEQ